MTLQDRHRFFGPSNAPADDTNACHRAFLGKALELHTQKGLQQDLIRTTKLCLAMGSGINANQFGKILTSFVRNDQRVMRETDPPGPASQKILQDYRAAFDLCFISGARISAAEQAWHDYIVPYRAACGMGLGAATWDGAGPRVSIGPRLPALFPAGSRLCPIDLTGAVVDRRVPKMTNKRKQLPSIEVEERPRKKVKIKFLGFVDLTE
ncbi:hypothetical protein B0H14DRAFT_2579054 [Mycena olivaceomarginata]|nr:hypothetical protein B0H14DRAFT_2579054 [Mycena olivaceomarginata]